jgi:hypothetical protein
MQAKIKSTVNPQLKLGKWHPPSLYLYAAGVPFLSGLKNSACINKQGAVYLCLSNLQLPISS